MERCEFLLLNGSFHIFKLPCIVIGQEVGISSNSSFLIVVFFYSLIQKKSSEAAKSPEIAEKQKVQCNLPLNCT